MSGFIHIFLLGPEQQRSGRRVPQFQLTYNTGGNSYVRVFDEKGLDEFLRSHAGMRGEAADEAIEELRRARKTTIADVEIKDYEAPALGLEQLPSDS